MIHEMDDHVPEQGFTLLELLISITIMSLVVVIMATSFRVGINAWEKGESHVGERQRLRIVLDIVKHQLSSISEQKMKIDGENQILFSGKSKEVVFVSRSSLLPDNRSGLSYLIYQVSGDEDKKETFRVFEKDFISIRSDSDLRPKDDKDFYTLLNKVQQIDFEYLKKEEDGYEWKPTWDTEKQKTLPLAVRMTVRTRENDYPIRVVARVRQ